MNVSTHVMEITPNLAREWLKQNTHNRRTSETLVDEYARDMANGDWVFNGETVKRAEDGTVLDGQHRLMAVEKSGVAITMLVVEGLPNYAQETVDGGRKRSVGDNLALAGEHYAHNLAAIARRAWQWDNRNQRFANKPSPTPSELRAYLELWPSLRRSSEIGHRVAMNFRPAKASVVGTAHHLFLRIDPDATAQYFATLETGADLVKGHPILALRERLINDKVMSRSISFNQSVAGFVIAWNAIRNGEERFIIKTPADGRMPMPV